MEAVRTARLLLRPWRDEDVEAFAALNADPRVMEFFPAVLPREESRDVAAYIRERAAQNGFGPWVIELPGLAPFIGVAGLSRPTFETAFTPCTEVLWRVAPDHWGHGFATEAANASLAYGFGPLALSEIVAFTVPANTRSRRVMEKLGMQHDAADDFEHPRLPPAHPLRPHVLYRAGREAFLAGLARPQRATRLST